MAMPPSVTVVEANGALTNWALDHSSSAGRHVVTLRSDSGQEFAGESWHVFDCLRLLREQLEPLGLRVCVNGSRRDAYESGMAADMSEGFVVELMSDEHGIPPMAPTYGFAPPKQVVTLAEQADAFEEWMRRPRPKRPLPATLTPDEAYRAACHLVHHCALRPGADPALLTLFGDLWNRHKNPGEWNLWREAVFSSLGRAFMMPDREA
jgi:hypothetical protein